MSLRINLKGGVSIIGQSGCEKRIPLNITESFFTNLNGERAGSLIKNG